MIDMIPNLCIDAGEIASWVTAISTFLLVVLTTWIACSAKKALYANTVSNSRPPYIDTLRKSFSLLHAELTRKDIDKEKFNEAFYWVIYHFNEYEEMKIDKPFIEFLNKEILSKIKIKQEIDDNVTEKYRKYSSSILQYEWDNFKKEIKLGRKLKMNEKLETKEKTIDFAIKNLPNVKLQGY